MERCTQSISIKLQCKCKFGLQDKPGYNKIKAASTNENADKFRSTRSGTHEDEFSQQDKPGYNKIRAANTRQGRKVQETKHKRENLDENRSTKERYTQMNLVNGTSQ